MSDRAFRLTLLVLTAVFIVLLGWIVLLAAPHIAMSVNGVLAGVTTAVGFIGVSLSSWMFFGLLNETR